MRCDGCQECEGSSDEGHSDFDLDVRKRVGSEMLLFAYTGIKTTGREVFSMIVTTYRYRTAWPLDKAVEAMCSTLYSLALGQPAAGTKMSEGAVSLKP